ncbi:BON domain-containing protein [Paraburkholderia pallida]|uniref:BON domain-containing protein n=1 Tax=Paraburkholderia pallida TaxID=2547399 RepID=A0A4P7D4V9_9BURK|nr:BON domain-containing protein [Paraburkholderia pallida]QBR03729.1 BON domain-containing protein [Paraburkholderia pallida]
MNTTFKRHVGIVAIALVVLGTSAVTSTAFAQDSSNVASAKVERKANRMLARDVRKALERAKFDVDDVRILAKHGMVSLDGTVPDGDQLSRVPDVAGRVHGVTSVASNLTVREEGR